MKQVHVGAKCENFSDLLLYLPDGDVEYLYSSPV